ncbi:TRAP transporter small permease [Pigmentiphaga aceris]|uniref:TRAP transporter small permease protein n=1 Tax=Pigmentiphaga aceris TaxID=1940612 RepID=A0A5C0B1Z1_9BURK|nr:TRAP transporter small permease [Pigmentiphaga aceris]QEI08839.1 TRAP transporter small permease [Pigmentiphaga aceris]
MSVDLPTGAHARPVGAEEDRTDAIIHSFEDSGPQDVDLNGYAVEDWIAMLLFWVMALFVFLQFFTRYVLNDSFAWTEELAVYCLIGVVFIGSSMCVRTNRHIQVDVLYRWLPKSAGRVLSTLVDIARVAFFAYGTVLVWRYVNLVGNEPMTTINWNKSHVYWVVLVAFVLMLLRSLQVAWQHWKQGYSILERPEAYDVV